MCPCKNFIVYFWLMLMQHNLRESKFVKLTMTLWFGNILRVNSFVLRTKLRGFE